MKGSDGVSPGDESCSGGISRSAEVEGAGGETSEHFKAYRSICFVRGFFVAVARGGARCCIPRSCILALSTMM